MAVIEWAVLCDHAFHDVRRKTCIIGIFDHIYAKQTPLAHPHAALVVRVATTGSETVKLRVDINRPAGGSLGKVAGEMQSPDKPGAGEIHIPINNLLLPDYGKYSIDLYLNDELVRTLPLTVERPPTNAARVN